EFRSRRLHAPPEGSPTRPMPDRVRESLFGLLRGHTEGAAVFDAFAGTGSIGLEAVSRGATRCVMVERDRRVSATLERNIRELGAEGRCEVIIGDALGAGALAACPMPVHLVFFDPPYALVEDAAGWQRARAQFIRLIDRLDETGYAVLRTPWPFLHTIHPPTAPPQPPQAHTTRSPRRRGRLADSTAHEEHESDSHAEAAISPQVPKISVDLSLPNAIGPETHVYHHTAVHLYMRRST
ncbi:MAG: RsmD family RNA methyltransferase, partial [Phycisphaeraceae bacterium]|nr:RsmD family RNA methyltransferase [Phycisphaeraceae bacterium]